MAKYDVSFEESLQQLIQDYGLENETNTPAFITADYLVTCYEAFAGSINWRTRFLGPAAIENLPVSAYPPSGLPLRKPKRS